MRSRGPCISKASPTCKGSVPTSVRIERASRQSAIAVRPYFSRKRISFRLRPMMLERGGTITSTTPIFSDESRAWRCASLRTSMPRSPSCATRSGRPTISSTSFNRSSSSRAGAGVSWPLRAIDSTATPRSAPMPLWISDNPISGEPRRMRPSCSRSGSAYRSASCPSSAAGRLFTFRLPSASSRCPKKTMYRVPTSTTGTPTGAKSSRWNGSRLASRSTLLTMMLLVVSSVAMPPSSVPKATPIKSFDGLVRVRRDRSITAGSSTAAAAMLFITSESSAAPSMLTTVIRRRLDPESRNIYSPIVLVTPVRNSACVRIKMAISVMTAERDSPEKVSCGLTSPDSPSMSATSSATRSGRTRSVAMRTTATARIASSRSMGSVSIGSNEPEEPPGTTAVAGRLNTAENWLI